MYVFAVDNIYLIDKIQKAINQLNDFLEFVQICCLILLQILTPI